jgi:hypothetical protein
VDLASRVVRALLDARHAETLALALAEAGRCAEAAEWQRRALELAAEAEAGRRESMRRDLARYEAGPPCRPPGDDAPASRASDTSGRE